MSGAHAFPRRFSKLREHPVKTSVGVYFTAELLAELYREAKRLDRSPSWLVLYAWKVARRHIAALPEPPGRDA